MYFLYIYQEIKPYISLRKSNYHIFSRLKLRELLISFLLVFVISSSSKAQEVIDITKWSPEENIGKIVGLFKDQSATMGIEEVSMADFVKSQKKVINLGYSHDNDWIKIKIHNPTKDNLEKIIKLSGLRMAEVELFQQYNGKWISVLGGGSTPKSKVIIRGINTYLPFTLTSKDTTSIYLRVKTHNSKVLPLYIISKELIPSESNTGFTIFGFIVGGILMITLYNLFLGFSTKDKLYFHYSLTNIFMLLGIIGERGFFAYSLPDDLNFLAPVFYPLTLAFWMVFSTSFNIKILELKKFSKWSYWALISVTSINFIIIVVLVTLKAYDYRVTYKLISISMIVFCLTAVISGVIALKKGSYYAKYYLFAWSSSLLGVALLIFTVIGIMPFNMFTRDFYVMGSVLELLIFSFALADRFNVLKAEKNRLKDKLVSTEGDLSVVISDNQIRHKFNKEVLVNLDSIITSEDNDLRKQLKSYANDIRLQNDVEEKMNFEQENIQEMDFEFKKKLKQKFPELSSAEIEVFLLMRLNLSIKEMARIRNSTESAIKSVRHRIRKKTNLDSTEITNLTLD